MHNDDPTSIHSRILGIAENISAPLFEALSDSGPVSFPVREDKGLAHHLSRAVIGQQLSIKAARSIWTRVEESATLASQEIPLFFNDANFDTLRSCGVSGNKVKALQAIRGADAKGRLCSKSLRQLDHKERSLQLLEIWGIGQWTCDMASISYCRCPDVWPEGDITVQKTFSRLIGRRKPSKAAFQFAPYRSYLALSMWRIADAVPSCGLDSNCKCTVSP